MYNKMQTASQSDNQCLFNEITDPSLAKILIASNKTDINSGKLYLNEEIAKISGDFFNKNNIFICDVINDIYIRIEVIKPEIIIIPFNIIPMNFYYFIKNFRLTQAPVQCIAYYTFESAEYEEKMISIMGRSRIFESFINVRYDNLRSVLKQISGL
jgi:hypothetical protein